MKLSCCIWALEEGRGPLRYWRRFRKRRVSETQCLNQLAELGFHSFDVCPTMQRTPEALLTREQRGLSVTCLSICHDAPSKTSFHSDDPSVWKPLFAHANDAIIHASRLGAHCAYVVPSPPTENLSCYAHRYTELAELGQQNDIKIGIEHFPGTAFPTVQSTLDFIKSVDHPNLYLLFDIGHAQMSNEDPTAALHLAGERLAYVHLDDNNGKDDLHLALTDGVQTKQSLKSFFSALVDIGYEGTISLEIHPTLPNPLDAIRRSKRIVEDLIEIR